MQTTPIGSDAGGGLAPPGTPPPVHPQTLTGLRARWLLVPLAALGPGLVNWLVTPAFGEPLGLRWLRALAEHPVRCALVAALGCWPRRPTPHAPGHGRQGRAGPAPFQGL